MKNLFASIVIILLFTQVSFAQSTPTPPAPPTTTQSTTSSTSKSTKINMNLGKDQKLKLRVNDADFDLDLDFKKLNTSDIRALITQYLGDPKASFLGTEEWADAGKTYRIRLSKGSLNASIDKDEMSSEEFGELMSFTGEVLNKLGWEVDLNF